MTEKVRKRDREWTAEEILEKARREARPVSPPERRRLERKGQQQLPGYAEWAPEARS